MHRTKTTKEQRKFLINYFIYNSRPGIDERLDISRCINLSPKSVTIWFQNERSRIKKEESAKNMIGNSNNYFSPCCNALYLTPTYENIQYFDNCFSVNVDCSYFDGIIQQEYIFDCMNKATKD
ncbi:Homeobox HD-10 [Tubulinosema ratisbonensis]|uniref:Homeobox HD-10 n=1 Tax=Tubulinosema ratisbonensis TaxID=291195 RepID=A0A437APY2_9MICR|nr:Homeobox HD-10 [Tubulinosema ratisbonensis]